MLLYFGSITMMHEENACLCDLHHIYPFMGGRSDMLCQHGKQIHRQMY
jgi:hypothetical protein